MSEFYADGIQGLVDNCSVYDLRESVKASKYPMSSNIESLNESITNTVCSLGSSPSGSGHCNFLSGIIVNFDLTLTNKAWVEAERYHFLQIVSSQSSMHKILEIGANKNNFDHRVDNRIIEVLNEKITEYNTLRESNIINEVELSEAYLNILMNIPSGMKLTARITTNYLQLKTILSQRKNHRLPEWRQFCSWIESLPHFKEIVLNGTAN